MRIPRPTYGSVTATIALFAALAGTSYAAITFSGANIRNGTLTGADLKDESVKGSDIDNALADRERRQERLGHELGRRRRLAARERLQGRRAAGRPGGPAGPQGPGGLANVVVRRSDLTVGAPSDAEAAASCANGEIAVGGGASHSGTVAENIGAVYGAPQAAGGSLAAGRRPGRTVVRGLKSNVGAPRTMTVYVLCTKP